MKKTKAILLATLVALSTFAIGIVAQAAIIKNERNNIQNDNIQPSLFDAEITFYIYEGTGCGCVPIRDAFINATSGDGQDSGVTDENGTCVLHMVINSDYRVSIEANDYNSVLFDFNVIDNQIFKFHLGEPNGGSSINTLPLFYRIITRLLGR